MAVIFNGGTQDGKHHWSVHSLVIDGYGGDVLTFDASSGEYYAALNRKEVIALRKALTNWLCTCGELAQCDRPCETCGGPLLKSDDTRKATAF